MTEALPIGNGPMGAMLFGGTEVERIQFNQISLWTGDRMAVEGLDDEGQDMGAYQAFGDILIHLGHDFATVTHYRQELDIDRAVHQVTYEYNGVRYQRTAFASHPDRVIVIHLTADKAAALTGRVQLADMHQARIAAAGNQLSSVGRMGNGFEYEAQLLVLNATGHRRGKERRCVHHKSMEHCRARHQPGLRPMRSRDLDPRRGHEFPSGPHPAMAWRTSPRRRRAASGFRRQAERSGATGAACERLSIALPPVFPRCGNHCAGPAGQDHPARLEEYAKNQTTDPDLEALFCQFGRYLLISCSRPGSLPANLQGVWNDSNEPAWAGDYHSNINLEMNDQEIIYDLFTNTIEAADVLGDDTEFRDHIAGLRDKLLKPKIGRWGQLQEWEADKDDPKDDHRHVSHLFALYPGRQITRAGTPELAEAARVSLQARGDASTGWSRAWKINFWARLWDGDHAYTMLRKLLTVVRETQTIYGESGAGVYPNLFDSHPPFQIDGNFGATAGFCEMLVQSHTGQIHLLPALPTAWPIGKVTGLCARGGFEVDMSWSDGHLTQAVIHSKSGLPCTVVCGDQTWEFNTTAGKSYPLTARANKQ